MNNKNLFFKVAISIITIATFNFNFVYGQGVSVISIHTDAYTPGGYEGGAHVIGSGTFANSLQSGLSTSADRFNIRKKSGVGTTAVNDGNATLNVAKKAGVTNAALIEVGAHRLLLEQYGTPTGVANSPYVTDLINNVIAPNVGSSGKIIIPMDHTRRQIPDTPGGNTYSNANATGAAEYNGFSERDVTDAIAAKIKAKFGDRVVILKPEEYQSYQEYDAAITSAAGGAATGSSSTTDTSSASTTAGTVSYQSYTNFPGVGRISNLCQLMNGLWLLGFAVLLTSVLGMFLYGGYIYVTAGVNAGKVNQAKEIFTNTITGLIIGLSIFIIINLINPGLLQGNCSIPPIGSTGTGAGQPTLGGVGGTVSGPAFNSGLYTGPSANIGGSAEYHIDTKIPKTTGWETIDSYFLNMARGYEQQGRVIEFSNVGVAGERYDPSAPQSTRISLLQRAAAAHAPRSEHSWDYYIPLKGDTRFSKSVEGAEMILPSIPGGRAEYSSGGNYGNYVVVYDSSGRVAYKTGHGDNRRSLPGTKTFPQ